MELAGDDGVLDEEFERNNLEGVLVGGFKDDGAGSACLLNLKPACGTDTPAVTGFESSEAVMRHGGAEVVAENLRRREEGSVDDATDGVDTVVVGAGLTTAGAVEARHGLAATDVEGLAEDVFATVFDGFDGGHDPVLL
jgi:hypothetical protein